MEPLRESNLTPPPNYKLGALPRTDKPGTYCGFFRDIPGINIIPQQEWADYISTGISLMPNSHTPYDQGQVGSCAAEGACGALEITRDTAGLPYVLFNPYGTYHYSGGGHDNGSTLTDNLRLLREMGAFPETVWPRSKGYRTEPSPEAKEAAKDYRIDEFYEVENWTEYGSALLQGYAMYSAYTGHAWCGVQLLNTTQIKFRNSWGTNWEDHGYGVLNKDVIQYNYGCFAIRTSIAEVNTV